MNPLVVAAISSILRFALAGLFGYLVSRGVWTNAEADVYLAAAVPALIALGWSAWNNYKDRRKLVTAMASSGPVSENQVDTLVAVGMSPPLNLSKDRIPYLEGEKPETPYAGPDKRTEDK